MSDSEADKLQLEIEKLKQEIRVFKRPLSQPNSWLAIIGLFISIVINFSQCSSVKNASELAEIQFERATLKFEKTTLANDSLQKIGDSLQAVESALANDYAALQASYEVRKKQVDSIQAKIDQALAGVAALAVGSTDTVNFGNTAAIGEIKKSLSVISAINQNVISTHFIRSAAKNLPLAQQKEREGFQHLIEGNYNDAIAAFRASENAFNGYHMVYELSRLIAANRNALSGDAGKRNEVIRTVLTNKYANGAPPDLINQLRETIKE